MANAVIMPRLGNSVESCVITGWNVKVGDAVKKGDVLVTYETDKATFDLESEFDGTMLAILREDGDDVPCLENICVIGEPGEDVSAFTSAAPAAEEAPKAEEAAPAAAAPAQNAPAIELAAERNDDIKISPRAKNLAEKTGVDYSRAMGTGPDGRVIERDIYALRDAGVLINPAAGSAFGQGLEGSGLGGRVSTGDLAAKPAEAAPAAAAEAVSEYEDVKMPNIRKVIAKAMQASLNNTAQLTLHASFDATQILAYRKTLKNSAEALGLGNITLNDIVMYAVSRVLMNHKSLNANLLDDTMRYFTNVNLGMAVDTERGLMVPTIFNANKKSLSEISAEAKSLAAQCQSGTINPDMLKGGTFTVTNLGSLGIEMFTPVINAPQTGILGVNTIVNRVKEVNGSLVTYPAMGLSLTFDHRALDGAPAAKFLKEMASALENFSALLAK